ncbi:MAG TPA: NADP-dependent oxidoreductase [Candidatus Acidoferrum sp.]|nr:NADP-dependent oxidoreductase [Candidatus Acidoferrum sp.]
MRAAGVRRIGGPVEALDLPDPRALAADEVLIAVEAAGMGNWDDLVRTGGWDVGQTPPMALGVEAAGTIVAIGPGVKRFGVGEEVLTHPLPLREQGTWAEKLIASIDVIALKPAGVSWATAGAFPVPALTADQVLSEALNVREGESLLVHGAGGVTGNLLVELASVRGIHVIATAGPLSLDRVRGLGAREVFDYHDISWPEHVRRLTGGAGVTAAANAAPGGATAALQTVADGGRLATITSDPPPEERGISVTNVYVRADGSQLATLAAMLGDGRLTLSVAASYPIEEAGAGLDAVVNGATRGAVVVVPERTAVSS